MGISKRAMGVEGFMSGTRPSPTLQDAMDLAPAHLDGSDNLKASLYDVTLSGGDVVFRYKLSNTKLIKATTKLTRIDEAGDQKEFIRKLIQAAMP